MTVHMHICVIGSPFLIIFPLPRISVHNSEKRVWGPVKHSYAPFYMDSAYNWKPPCMCSPSHM